MTERGVVLPEAAGVAHGLFVEHAAKQERRAVVVMLGHVRRARARLRISEPRPRIAQVMLPAARVPRGAGLKHAEDHLVDGVTLPVTVEIGLAQLERRIERHAPIEGAVVDTNVPGAA